MILVLYTFQELARTTTNHRMVCVGRDLKDHLVPAPATGRDTFHQTRLPRAPSSLALGTARDGAPTAALGSLGQRLAALTVKNFFPISHLNLPSFSLKPFPLVHAPVRSPPQLPCRPLWALSGAVRSPRSLLLPRLSHPSSPSLSPQQSCSSP